MDGRMMPRRREEDAESGVPQGENGRRTEETAGIGPDRSASCDVVHFAVQNFGKPLGLVGDRGMVSAVDGQECVVTLVCDRICSVVTAVVLLCHIRAIA